MSRKKSYLSLFLPGLSDRIRKIRGELTQEEFGKTIGVNQGTVFKYEKGMAFPGDETLKKIADFGKVTVEWLATGKRKPLVRDEAQQPYEIPPTYLDRDALSHTLLLVDDWLRRRRLKFSPSQKAALVAHCYDYWLVEHFYPDDEVIARLRDLVP